MNKLVEDILVFRKCTGAIHNIVVFENAYFYQYFTHDVIKIHEEKQWGPIPISEEQPNTN